jgi:hypothetical protein
MGVSPAMGILLSSPPLFCVGGEGFTLRVFAYVAGHVWGVYQDDASDHINTRFSIQQTTRLGGPRSNSAAPLNMYNLSDDGMLVEASETDGLLSDLLHRMKC